jgi:hypothetical protein
MMSKEGVAHYKNGSLNGFTLGGRYSFLTDADGELGILDDNRIQCYFTRDEFEEFFDIITLEVGEAKKVEEPKPSKYDKKLLSKCGKVVTVDVYCVNDAFEPKGEAVRHAVKKLLQAGGRGSKDEVQDLNEAIESINRRLLDLRNRNESC